MLPPANWPGFVTIPSSLSKARTGPIGLHYVRIGFKATRRYGDLVSSNPFDDGDGDGNVLVAVIDEQHSRWQVLADVRIGTRVHGDAARGACRDYIQDHWPAIRAGSLRENLGGSIDR